MFLRFLCHVFGVSKCFFMFLLGDPTLFSVHQYPWRIHGAAILMVTWIPSIYPSHVSIYTIRPYMDPSWDISFILDCFSSWSDVNIVHKMICLLAVHILKPCSTLPWSRIGPRTSRNRSFFKDLSRIGLGHAGYIYIYLYIYNVGPPSYKLVMKWIKPHEYYIVFIVSQTIVKLEVCSPTER